MEELRAVYNLGRDRAEIGRARRLATDFCRSRHLDVGLSALALGVSETVTNALVHGSGRIELTLEADAGGLLAQVSDDGTATTVPRIEEGRDIGGWGLQIVDHVTDGWGVSRDGARRVLWMRFLPPHE